MFLNRVCVLVFIAASVTAKEYRNELVLQDETRVGSVIKTTPPSKETVGDMPENYDLRGTGLLTTNLNQHIPVYCGSCWAHAALSSIADRIKIANKGQNSDIVPSIQALINCGTAGTCNGGDSNAANQWVYENGIPDVTCQQYEAKNKECSAINTCMNCDYNSDVGCYAVENYPVIKVSEFGTVYGDENIMAEIYARGPVSAYINANCIEDYDGGINMYDTCPPHLSNHAIQLNGWGSENGTDYWIGRNSWGSYWGENGMFRIVRGGAYKPNKAFWAVPEVPESMLK